MNRAPLLLAIALGLSGCIDAVLVDVAQSGGEVELEEMGADRFGTSWVQGDVGSLRGLWDDTPSVQGRALEDRTWIDVRGEAQGGGGAAVVSLVLEGGLDDPMFAPGALFPIVHCPKDPDAKVTVYLTEEPGHTGSLPSGSVRVAEGNSGGVVFIVEGSTDDEVVLTAGVEVLAR